MLREQSFNIASLDRNMEIIQVHRVETSGTESETTITNFDGPQETKIHALLINQGAHGYAKFCVPELTLKAFETGLNKIESSQDRKMCLNMMFDLVKSGNLPASRLLNIILNNIQHETAVDVLQDTFRFLIPTIIDKYLHNEAVEGKSTQTFALLLKIMNSGRFNNFPSAMETLISSSISFASNADQVKLIYKWFITGKVTNLEASEIAGAEINVKVRHTMVRKIFSSAHIPKEQKKECFATLSQLDTSDMLGRTEKYCQSADPDP